MLSSGLRPDVGTAITAPRLRLGNEKRSSEWQRTVNSLSGRLPLSHQLLEAGGDLLEPGHAGLVPGSREGTDPLGDPQRRTGSMLPLNRKRLSPAELVIG